MLLGAGANPMLAMVQAARGIAALGAGRFDDAYALSVVPSPRRTWPITSTTGHSWWRSSQTAAAHCGRQADARRLIAGVEPLAERTGSPILRAELLVARPLLAEEEDVERLYLEGLADGLPSMAPPPRSTPARLRRVAAAAATDSRGGADPLRTARETFAALGATPWAEQAGQGLRAAGEPHLQTSAAAWEQLTAQELQIATMAAEGLTNRQIGERLFLSHRTVGAHLYHMFPKLGIASRSQLGSALAGVGGGSTPA